MSIGVIAQSAAQSAPSAASAQELYQRGLVQEHAQGDLQQAIALYAQAARTAGSDRALAAKALIRMAGSQEKLGANADAARAYAEVVRAYPEQRPEVAIAQEQLAALRRATSEEGAALEPRWSCCRDRRVVVDAAIRRELLRQLPQRAEQEPGPEDSTSTRRAARRSVRTRRCGKR